MEWAGAFGDLGTLLPFLIAYVSVLKVDPCGMLFAFGSAMLFCGAHYKTPFPVQPMKAVGAVAITQAAQTAVITPAALVAAALLTGVIWLLLGLTGAASRIGRLVGRPVVIGIVLGLGMNFMLDGIRMMAQQWWLGAFALLATLLLLTNRKVPVMFLLLLFGAGCGAFQLGIPTDIRIEARLPTIALGAIGWNELMIGFLFLALPQLPLTLGNAVIAIREENNSHFPDRPVTDSQVATSTGLINLGAAAVGGVPMCHGAGGMAGHVAFGARTGGAPIILGAILVLTAVLFSSSVESILRMFSTPVLGVVLFVTGAQLALGSCDFSRNKPERFVTLITAAFAMWNVGLAFLVGVVAAYAIKRGALRL